MKDLTARLEDAMNERDTVTSTCKQVTVERDGLLRDKHALEAALATSTATSADVAALQVCATGIVIAVLSHA